MAVDILSAHAQADPDKPAVIESRGGERIVSYAELDRWSNRLANVLIEHGNGRPRVCPVDWETAAVGPGLIDLAALTAGDWADEQRRALVSAYREALPGGTEDEVLTDLDYCRLHSAVQWAGWSADWSPPPECARDWLADALALADRLGLC